MNTGLLVPEELEIEVDNPIECKNGNKYDLSTGEYKLLRNGGVYSMLRKCIVGHVTNSDYVVKNTAITPENAIDFKLDKRKKELLAMQRAEIGMARAYKSPTSLDAWEEVNYELAKTAQRNDMVGIKALELLGKYTGFAPGSKDPSGDSVDRHSGLRMEVDKDTLLEALATVQRIKSMHRDTADYDIVDG